MNTLRVHDSDFAAGDPANLRAIAWNAVVLYRGNWDTMISWKNYVLTNQATLSDKQSRAVLNAVLSDSNQSHLWATVRQALIYSREDGDAEPTPPKLKLIRNDPNKGRKLELRFRAVIHADYGKPTQRNGVVHVIDHSKTYMEWKVVQLPYEPWYDWDAPRVPTLSITWKCQTWRSASTVLVYNEPPEGINRCRKCQEM